MTLIFDTGEFWIESIHIARQAETLGQVFQRTFTITKPGRFVGGSATMDIDLSADVGTGSTIPFGTTLAKNVSGDTLNFGDPITGGVVYARLQASGPNVIGFNVIMMLKK